MLGTLGDKYLILMIGRLNASKFYLHNKLANKVHKTSPTLLHFKYLLLLLSSALLQVKIIGNT